MALRGSVVVNKFGSEYRVMRYLTGGSDVVSDDKKSSCISLDDERFYSSISRARSRVFELAACNDWDYFVTLTLSDKWDRNNLDEFRKSLTQWLRDEKKRLHCDIQYLFIPELHKKGGWHMHGFLRGLPCSEISEFFSCDIGFVDTDKGVKAWKADKLNKKGYKNWKRFSKKFGYCSLGKIKSAKACSRYITKYITKTFSVGVLEHGAHLYYASQGLHGKVYVGGGYSVCDNKPQTEKDKRAMHYFCNDYMETWFVDDVSKLPVLADVFTGEKIQFTI